MRFVLEGSFLNAQSGHTCPIKINWIRYVYLTNLHTNPHCFLHFMNEVEMAIESDTIGQVGERRTKVEGTTWQLLTYRCMISTINCVNLAKSMARILGSCKILLSHRLGAITPWQRTLNVRVRVGIMWTLSELHHAQISHGDEAWFGGISSFFSLWGYSILLSYLRCGP